MNLEFDLENVEVTEFGVGLEDGGDQKFVVVPVDANVQAVLQEMVKATWEAMQNDEDGPTEYDPSEKYESTEYLYLSLDNPLVSFVKNLHTAELPIDSSALDAPSKIFCYFTRLRDERGRRLTAIRRATQFKGVLKARLIRLVSDSLKLIKDQVFKLDTDFDFLVDSNFVYILRPSGFEFVSQLREAILNAVSKNIKEIQRDLHYVELTPIEEYAKKHPRAARYLASIRSRELTKNIKRDLLKKLCKQTGVEVTESKGKLIIPEGHEMAFLELLDRRRYELELVNGQPERYKAMSRKRIQENG